MARRIIPLLAGLMVFATAFAAPAATGTTSDAAGVARAEIGDALTRQADVPWMLLATLIVAVGITLIVGKRTAPRPVSIRPPKIR